MLVATLDQAVVADLVLIVAPLAAVRRARRHDPVRRPSLARVALYFLCLGLAFLAVEIAFIQRFTPFFAHPLYAIAVVLAGLLVFAGAGSAAWARLRISLAVSAMVALAITYAPPSSGGPGRRLSAQPNVLLDAWANRGYASA